MVPGAAWAGLVAPVMSRTTSQLPSGPSTTMARRGERVMKVTSALEERLADVLGVVARGPLGVDMAQLGRHQAQAFALQAADDLPAQPALDGIGLAQDERSGDSHAPERLPACCG